MTRTKIRQVIQIANSESYADGYANAHLQATAEPSHPDFTIEYDLNIIRTQLKNLKGSSHWYASMDGYSLVDLKDGYDTHEAEIGALQTDAYDLEAAVGSSTGVAGMDYTSNNIVTDGEAATKAIGDLDGYLNTLASAVAQFTGMDGYNDVSPDYSANFGGQTLQFVNDGYTLEEGITALDLALQEFDPTVTLQDAWDNSQSAGPSNPEIDVANLALEVSSNLGSLLSIGGDAVTIQQRLVASDIDSATSMTIDGAGIAMTSDAGQFSISNTASASVGSTDGYITFNDGWTAHDVHLSTGDLTWSTAIATYLNKSGQNVGIIDAINAASLIADSVDLQTAYEKGATIDLVDTEGDLVITVDSSAPTANFIVKDADGSSTMELTGDHFKVYDANDNDPTFEITDGYVKIDGYLTVTGSSFIVDSTINDADHWVLHPGLSTQTALKLEPKTSAGAYTADLMEVYDGYESIDGNKVMKLNDEGAMFLASDVDAVTPDLITVADAGDLFVGSRLEVDGQSRFDGLMDVNAGIQVSTSLQYDVSPTDGHFLKTDASGNASWEQIFDNDVDLSATLNVPGAGSTVQTGLEALDAYAVETRGELDLLETSLGDMIATDGSWDGFGPGTNLLDASADAYNAFLALDEGYGSLQASLDAIDVTGVTSEVTVVESPTGTFEVGVAENFVKSDFTNFDVASSSGISLTSTGALNDVALVSDGYVSFDDQFLADAYYLSTGATGWASTIEEIDGRSGNDIGIIDAINAAASAGGGKLEKGIFIIAASDGRLSSSGSLSSNILDMDAGTGADRGSLDLNISGGSKLARDVEVYVNGVLQLPDASQGTASDPATDDFFIASDDLTKIVFAYDLVEGDVVTVINRVPDTAENDLDTNWNY